MKYKAYLVEENEGTFSGSIKELDTPEISEGKVLIKVEYSSLNYKDCLLYTSPSPRDRQKSRMPSSA